MRYMTKEELHRELHVIGTSYLKLGKGRRKYAAEHQARVESGAKMIYAIQGGVLVKIGIATDVRARQAQLQTGSPHKLKLLFRAECPPGEALSVERECHSELKKWRRHGEWFALEPDVLVRSVKDILLRRGIDGWRYKPKNPRK